MAADLIHISEPLRHLAVPLGDLHPDPANARNHSARNLDAIKASLRKFGQRQPIVVQRQGMIIQAGNARFIAARDLGWSHIAAVVVEEDDVTATAYAIADNRTAELAEWDGEVLAAHLQSLEHEGFDLECTGFSDEELADLIRSVTPADELEDDEAPERPEDPITKSGDLWQVGRHRVLCGDSTAGADVERLLDGATPLLMVTDPPYGVDYDPEWRNEAAKSGSLKSWAPALSVGRVRNDDRADWGDAWALSPSDVAYTWSPPGPNLIRTGAALQAARFEVRSQIIWRKAHFAISRGAYHYQHEPCWYAVRKGRKSRWIGDRSQSTVWEIDHRRNETGHSTQKPIECMARPIRHHDSAEVYDPFLGSGTTLVAAEQLGRSCFGMEIDPGYCDVIVQRWEALTGERATNLGGAR